MPETINYCSYAETYFNRHMLPLGLVKRTQRALRDGGLTLIVTPTVTCIDVKISFMLQVFTSVTSFDLGTATPKC